MMFLDPFFLAFCVAAAAAAIYQVRRVLEGVGLGNVSFAGFLTPDTR